MRHQGGRERAWMESNTLLNAWTTVQSVVVSDRSTHGKRKHETLHKVLYDELGDLPSSE